MDNAPSSKIRASHIKNEKLRKLKIVRTVGVFVHAHRCTDPNCKEAECDEMKALLVHFKECTRTSRKECPPCLQVLALTRHHAKYSRDCESNFCLVQFCARMKCHVLKKKQKKIEDVVVISEDEEEFVVEVKQEVAQTEQNFEPLPSTSAQIFSCPTPPLNMTSLYLSTNEMNYSNNRGMFQHQEVQENHPGTSFSDSSLLWRPFEPVPREDFYVLKDWQYRITRSTRLDSLNSLEAIFKVNESFVDKSWILRLEDSLFRKANSEQEYQSLIAQVFIDVVINKRC